MKFVSDFPEVAKEWHPTKNGNLTPYDIISGSHKKYWWYREECGHEWQTSCQCRISLGTSCPYCFGNKVCIDNCLATRKPEVAKEWHPTKNGNLTPYDVRACTARKYWWYREECGHEWKTSCECRVRLGKNCPYCSESKGQKLITKFLKDNNIKFISEYVLSYRGRADFYLTELNVILEFQGKQHYIPSSFGSKKKDAKLKMFVSVVESDAKKALFCKLKNKKLIRIPFWEIENIEKILQTFLIEGNEYEFSKAPESVKENQGKRDAIIDRFKKKLDKGLIKI